MFGEHLGSETANFGSPPRSKVKRPGRKRHGRPQQPQAFRLRGRPAGPGRPDRGSREVRQCSCSPVFPILPSHRRRLPAPGHRPWPETVLQPSRSARAEIWAARLFLPSQRDRACSDVQEALAGSCRQATPTSRPSNLTTKGEVNHDSAPHLSFCSIINEQQRRIWEHETNSTKSTSSDRSAWQPFWAWRAAVSPFSWWPAP